MKKIKKICCIVNDVIAMVVDGLLAEIMFMPNFKHLPSKFYGKYNYKSCDMI